MSGFNSARMQRKEFYRQSPDEYPFVIFNSRPLTSGVNTDIRFDGQESRKTLFLVLNLPGP